MELAVQEEIEGPGKLLAYQALHEKIREKHELSVPRDLVYDLMTFVDPEEFERRSNVGRKKHNKGPTGTFTSMVYLTCLPCRNTIVRRL